MIAFEFGSVAGDFRTFEALEEGEQDMNCDTVANLYMRRDAALDKVFTAMTQEGS